MILLIDNYDSFTFNLFQYVEEAGHTCRVVRNDRLSLDDIKKLKPDAILLSPGPGNPDSAGICLDLVRTFAGRFPILGICLGHQTIGQAFGGKVKRARQLMHGKTSMVYHHQKGMYRGIPNPFRATRYHSLIVERSSLPACLYVTAQTQDQTIMGIRHRKFPVEGVQYHPESMMTEHGKAVLANFLKGL